MAVDLSATVAGVRLPFAAMNASGTAGTTDEVRRLLTSRTGAVVLKTATVHPFVHPEFRSLHNPGFDKLVPFVREIAAAGEKPVIASVAGTTPEEFALLARAFAEAGAALVEANLADPFVAATLAPFETPGVVRDLLGKAVLACPVPLSVKLPERVAISYGRLADELNAAGVRVVVVRNEFTGLEKFLLEAGAGFEAIAIGGIRSGYDVTRALAKGAKAVQVGSPLALEGPGIFARLEREMRIARGERER
jgi:dihydroorotate dehydrogenase